MGAKWKHQNNKKEEKNHQKKRLGNINAFQLHAFKPFNPHHKKKKNMRQNKIQRKKGNRIIIYFDFCPIFSFNFNPPPGVAGVDGVPGVEGWGAGEANLFGICNFGKDCELEVDDGVLGLGFGCLKVMRGPGGGMPWSSRLRFAEAAAASLVRVVRTLSDL